MKNDMARICRRRLLMLNVPRLQKHRRYRLQNDKLTY